MCISRVAISVCVMVDMRGSMVSHWKTARAFAMLMRIAKELNTGPGVECIVVNAQIRIRSQSSPIQGTPISPRLFTKKVTARYKECIW